MEFLKLTCGQKQYIKSGSRDWKWWPSSFFKSQLKLLKSGVKTYCSQWMRHSPKHQFRKAFLGDNWLCETHISLQGKLVFAAEGSGDRREWGQTYRDGESSTLARGQKGSVALLLTWIGSLCTWGLSTPRHWENELGIWASTEVTGQRSSAIYLWDADKPSDLSGLLFLILPEK